MPNFMPISVWDKTQPFEDGFFLKTAEYPKLYSTALKLYDKTQAALALGDKPAIQYPKPVEQLSAKGLALMSHIYAQKDNNPAQPLVALGEESLKHVIQLVDHSPLGTGVPVIYQPSDRTHKTVFWLEKSDIGFMMINMDSLVKSYDQEKEFAKRVLQSKLYYYSEVLDVQRQHDGYQCGVFTMKDARHIVQDPEFSEHVQNSSSLLHDSDKEMTFLYQTPVPFLKSVQDTEKYNYRRGLLVSYADEVVTKTNMTLATSYQKHEPYGYIAHFSQKMSQTVLDYLDKHEPTDVKQATGQYDAGVITAKRLVSIYGPKGDQKLLIILSGMIHGKMSDAILFVQGYDINQGLYHHYTALQCAARSGQTPIVEFLARKQADLNIAHPVSGASALQLAIQYNHLESAHFLSSHALINKHHVDTNGLTALHYAALYSMSEIIEALIKSGIDIHAKDKLGFQAIHYACSRGDLITLKQLLEWGADSEARSSHDQTPLHIMAQQGHDTLIAAVITSDANLNVEDKDQNTPLQLAIISEKLNVIKRLMTLGADVNHLNSEGNSPLHLAVATLSQDLITYLLDKNANVAQKNKEGKTALEMTDTPWVKALLAANSKNKQPKTST